MRPGRVTLLQSLPHPLRVFFEATGRPAVLRWRGGAQHVLAGHRVPVGQPRRRRRGGHTHPRWYRRGGCVSPIYGSRPRRCRPYDRSTCRSDRHTAGRLAEALPSADQPDELAR
eukprot:scaffold15188_cov85-Isochrysis_galbana.AAC.2